MNHVAESPDQKAVSFWTLLVVFIITLLFCSLSLGVSSVFEVSEAREGVVVQEMLKSGNLLLPLRNGEIVPSKPLLFHWISALLWRVLPGSPEFLLRFPSALAAAGVVTIFFWFVHTVTDRSRAAVAAAMLAVTSGFLELAEDGRVDMLFCFFTTAAMLVWIRQLLLLQRRGRPLSEIQTCSIIAVAVLCGCSVLVKGPLGFVLPGILVAVTAFQHSKVRGIISCIRLEWLLAIVVPLPWYMLAAKRGGKEFLWRLLFENVGRFRGDPGISQKPWWFYAEPFWGIAAPWSVIFVLVLVVGWKIRAQFFPIAMKCSSSSELTKYQFLNRYLLGWIVAELIFLSVASGKRGAYLLLILPPFVLWVFAICDLLSSFMERGNPGKLSALIFGKIAERSFALFWIVTFLIALSFYCSSWFDLPASRSVQLTLQGIQNAIKQDVFRWILLSVVFGGGSIVLWRQARMRQAPIFRVWAGIALCAWVMRVHVPVITAGKASWHSYKEFVPLVRSEMRNGEILHIVKKRLDESYDVFLYYFGEHVRMVSPKELLPEKGLYLARRLWFDGHKSELPGEVEILGEGGRESEGPNEKVVIFRLS